MRLFIFLFTTLMVAACTREKSAENGYIIEGRISGVPDSTQVTLVDINSVNINKTIVRDSRFRLTGHFAQTEPEQLMLILRTPRHMYHTSLIIGNNRITITGDVDDFPNDLTINGSPYREDQKKLENVTRDLQSRRDSLISSYVKLSGDQKKRQKDNILVQIDKLDRAITTRTKNYIKTHLDNYPALIRLSTTPELIPGDSLKVAFAGIRPGLRASKYGKVIETYLNEGFLNAGDNYFDFSAREKSGGEVRFSSYLDGQRYILLDFTSTYCPPCVMAASELRKINKKYSDKIRVVSFTTDVQEKRWQTFIERDSVSWVSLWDGRGRFGETVTRYGIPGVPTFFLIDPAGKIIDKQVGYEEGLLTEKLLEHKIIAAQ